MLHRTLFLPSLLSTSFLRPVAYDGTSLSAFYTDEAEIPDTFKSLYVKRGERWELNVAIEGVNGVKSFSDFANIAEALRKERTDHKAVKASIAKLGRPIDEVLADLDRIPELEAAAEGGADPKKLDKLVDARLQAKLAPVERELATARTQLTEAQAAIKTHEEAKTRRQIHDQVREQATKLKLLPEALEDALMLSERVLELDDKGVALVRDESGYGVGLTTEGWLKELQTKKPHWWGPSEGGGAGGNRGSGGDRVTNPWSKESHNLTLQGQITRDDPALAERLKKTAKN